MIVKVIDCENLDFFHSSFKMFTDLRSCDVFLPSSFPFPFLLLPHISLQPKWLHISCLCLSGLLYLLPSSFLLLFVCLPACLLALVPLPDAELSGHAAGLVLNHIRHEVWAQLYVCPSVAAHIVVVGCREQSEDLSGGHQESVQLAGISR